MIVRKDANNKCICNWANRIKLYSNNRIRTITMMMMMTMMMMIKMMTMMTIKTTRTTTTMMIKMMKMMMIKMMMRIKMMMMMMMTMMMMTMMMTMMMMTITYTPWRLQPRVERSGVPSPASDVSDCRCSSEIRNPTKFRRLCRTGKKNLLETIMHWLYVVRHWTRPLLSWVWSHNSFTKFCAIPDTSINF